MMQTGYGLGCFCPDFTGYSPVMKSLPYSKEGWKNESSCGAQTEEMDDIPPILPISLCTVTLFQRIYFWTMKFLYCVSSLCVMTIRTPISSTEYLLFEISPQRKEQKLIVSREGPGLTSTKKQHSRCATRKGKASKQPLFHYTC